MSYVICPETITGPSLSPAMKAIGLTENMPCGSRCPVVTEAPVMEFRCPRGHVFIATPKVIHR